MTTHLVIPDSHAKPGVSNERYSWLGEFVLEHQPEVIIDLGDWADMESLSSYDKGKRSFEGRRYSEDVKAARDAREKFNAPIDKYNNTRSRFRKKQYKPRMVHCVGNHENRIDRATQLSPELHDTLSMADLGAAEFGWEVHDFLKTVVVDGVAYCHYFTSGIMGRSISGLNPARMLLNKKHMSCTQGHSHLRDFAEDTRPDGTRILGLVAGWYANHYEDYAGPANDMWWPGIVMCHGVHDGMYEPQFIGIDTLEDKYS